MFKNVVKQIMGCGLKLVHCFWNYTIGKFSIEVQKFEGFQAL